MRILCVDDEPAIRDVLKRVLSEDHDVVCLSNGCEAIERLQAGAEYDVVVCDILMPDCSGIDLYRSLERDRPEMCPRMVFLTGGSLIPGIESFVKETKCVILDKPFSIDDLLAAVEKVAGSPPM